MPRFILSRNFFFIFLTIHYSIQNPDSSYARDDHYLLEEEDNHAIEVPLKRPTADLKMGLATMNIGGLDLEAQHFFNQGLSAIHGFWLFEAERNFREVIRRFPAHPIGYAMAAFTQLVFSGGDSARGGVYMSDARSRMTLGTAEVDEFTFALIEAVASLYDTRVGDKKERRIRHIELLRSLHSSDIDVSRKRETGALLALALWNYKISVATDEEKKSSENLLLREEVDSLISEVLRWNPKHPIHHYRIHLWNDGENEILASQSADVCGVSNPDCAHLWHMPSHIYFGLREFRNASYNFEAAQRVDNAYLKKHKLTGHVIHNYAHNIDFFLTALAKSGGVDRAIEIAKSSLGGPRFFQATSSYVDPVEGPLMSLLYLLEVHGMWAVGESLNESKYFKDVYLRDSDKVLRARLERFLGRIELESGRIENGQRYAEKIRKIRQSVDPKEKSANDTIGDILKVEKDLGFWHHIRRNSVRGAVLRETILKMEALKITTLPELALVSFENEHTELALKLAQDAISAAPSDVMAHAVYTYILTKSGKKSAALKQWEVTKHLVHLPHTRDTEKAKGVSIENSFPFLARLKHAFEEKKIVAKPQIDKLFIVPESGAQHSLRTWSQMHMPMSNLGPLTLDAPSAHLGPMNENLWRSMKGHMTDSALKRLTEIPAAPDDSKEWVLIIFRKNLMCDGCNREETRLVEQYADLFKVNDTNIVIVSPDDRTNEEKPLSDAVSVIGDLTLESFKLFGAFDEFTDEVSHGVFLVDHNNKIRWSLRSPHAFTDWPELNRELLRLRLIHN